MICDKEIPNGPAYENVTYKAQTHTYTYTNKSNVVGKTCLNIKIYNIQFVSKRSLEILHLR